jgi:hypothetical protein
MPSTLRIWGRILQNPFTGYGQINKDTRIAWPLACILLLVAVSTSLLLPITSSPTYLAAALRVQTKTLESRGVEMGGAQGKALEEQLNSPVMRTFTVVSAYLGALISSAAVMLLLALLMKAFTSAMKVSIPYRQLLAIFLFTGLVTAVQGLLKAGITLASDWRGALQGVQTTADLKAALVSPLSLALLFPYASLGKLGFALLDTATDVFHWIYFTFLYAGMKSAGLDKKRALAVTLLTAVLFLAVGAVSSLLF